MSAVLYEEGAIKDHFVSLNCQMKALSYSNCEEEVKDERR